MRTLRRFFSCCCDAILIFAPTEFAQQGMQSRLALSDGPDRVYECE